MFRPPVVLLCLAALAGCAGESLRDAASLALVSVSPTQVSARGGAQLTLTGEGFTANTTVALGGVRAESRHVSDTALIVTAPPLWAGPASLAVTEAGDTELLQGAVEVLPLELEFVETNPLETAPITSLAPVDLDRDLDVDLFVCGPGLPCRVLRNDGRGNFDIPTSERPIDAGKPTDAGAADAGRLDAGARDAGVTDAGSVDAGGPKLSALIAARLLGAEDLDGDGDDDVVLASADGGVFAFSGLGHGDFGPGTRVLEPLVADAGPLPLQPITAFLVADLDHDGKPDLISAGATPQLGPFRVDLNVSRAGALAFKFTAGIPPQPWAVSALTVADVDGDRALDVVLATTGGDGTTLRLFTQHEGVFSEVLNGLPSSGGGPWAALAAGDVDGDGDVDLVAVGPGQDRLLINDGLGHFFDATASALPIDGSKGTSVVLVDLDRDHDLDLVIGNATAAMRLYLNDGTGKFLDRTPALPVRSDTSAALCAANLDGDGDLDLVIVTGAVPRLNLSVEPR